MSVLVRSLLVKVSGMNKQKVSVCRAVASFTRVLSFIQEWQPSMLFIMLVDIPAFLASFSCVSLTVSRYFLMFVERVSRKVRVFSLMFSLWYLYIKSCYTRYFQCGTLMLKNKTYAVFT